MRQHHSSFTFLSIGLSLLALSESCTITDPLRTEPYEKGVVVLESGQSGKNNASVSFLRDKQAIPDIFSTANDRSLGDLLRSYTEIDGKGYLIVSNSDKVEVVENSTFRSISFINEGVEQGRYMVAAPPQRGLFLKGYISYWGGKTLSPGVAVVSLADRKVIKAIPTNAGPEQMAVVGDQLFVANSGGTGIGNTISIINTTTDQLVTTISVGDVPTSIAYDPVGGLLHVLCSGRPLTNGGGTTLAELVRINPTTRQVVNRVSIGGRPLTGNPSNLVINPITQMLYFLLRGAVYASPINAATISIDRPILNQSFTGLGIEPTSGIIYGGYSRDSTSKGVVRRFQPNGTRIDSVTVGFVPSGFYFK
ncbi:YncE family protein [Fibrivirga algicola]|uniref:YncE family protein n=1 Tax=Fibrivirga algicola TaxID=2950420 RepID=A0ABX0QNS1_9BACT|nr:DUF5074 domain-containing protein [Fibrivirga algicola]NID12433.1 hypothetical protein [Fibrivirga algicola]